MKILASIMLGAALIAAPVAADARGGGGGHGGGGGGFHGGGGGGFRGGGGGFHGGGGYRGGGFHGGGYYRGGWGGYGYGWGFPFFYGAGLGFYLGYYDDPWYWGYPGYDYAYPVYPAPAYAPPARDYDGAPPVASTPPPQACGNWQFSQTDRQYHWVTNGCS